MTPKTIKKAKEMHERLFVADAHYDMLNLVAGKRIEREQRNVITRDYLERLRAGGVNLLICSLFIDNWHIPEMALRRALDQIACLLEEIDEGAPLKLCRNTTDIHRANEEGRIAILLSFEGVDPIGNDLRLLRIFYELGIRGVGLVWSRRNYAADGCFFSPREEGRKGGLTDFGVQLVRECERLGMYLDVSHLNDEGFQDLCDIAQKPFIASHSNCRALTPVTRNLTDEMMLSLARHGGIMGMNCSGNFVRLFPDGPFSAHEMSVHGAHVKELIGADHLCFGFDFCDEIRTNEGRALCDSINFYDHAYELTAELIENGFTDEEIQGVLGGNIMSFLERTIG